MLMRQNMEHWKVEKKGSQPPRYLNQRLGTYAGQSGARSAAKDVIWDTIYYDSQIKHSFMNRTR
jgi:hypothetical protein